MRYNRYCTDMDNTKTNAVLTIKNPPQYGVVREVQNEISKSIFYSIYVDALKNISDIIKTNENNAENDEKIRNFSPERINTTIAFVGKRGSGKSTAMCNFAGILDRVSPYYDLTWAKGNNLNEEDVFKINSNKFRVLDVIDSAQLGFKETLIGRISAAMYSNYKEMAQKNEPQLTAEKKRSFVNNMSKVNQYAVMYHTGEWFKSGESLLDDTYHVSSLRKEMSELVKSYLKLVSGKEVVKDEYLVVSIDDLDMGIENSYSIMEEIRKFLCISNIIVLVTLRMDQIHVALRAKFEKQLESKIDVVDGKMLIEDLAYRYTEKLFPDNRQHQMPLISYDQLIQWEARFESVTHVTYGDHEPCVLYSILGLIWKKTLMIPVCNSDGDHLLVPRNLRSLCNMVSFLQNLPDVEEDGKISAPKGTEQESHQSEDEINEKKAKIRKNLQAFSRYLVSNIRSFEQEYVSEEDRRFSEELISIIHNIEHIPLKKINACIVGDILYYLKGQSEESYYRKIFTDICPTEIIFPKETLEESSENKQENDRKSKNDSKPKNELDILIISSLHPECISLGDLMFVLGKIDSKTRCWYIKYLIEVIRTLWSAKMTENYFTAEESENHKTFYDVVGNLIVNPDVGFFDSNTSDFACSNEYRANEASFYIGKITKSGWEWRRNRGEVPKYAKCLIKHPLAPITSESLREYMPFYSFDFVYRLYEVLHDEVETITSFKEKVDYLYGGKAAIKFVLKTMPKNQKITEYTTCTIDGDNLGKKIDEIKNKLNIIKNKEEFCSNLKKCESYSDVEILIEDISNYSFDESVKKQVKEEFSNTPNNNNVETLIEKIIRLVK